MINGITCTSNNVIQLSRGQLIAWVNSTIKVNITKIEQLGTGVAYCQLLDMLFPGKVPLSKVNAKAKLDYEYVNNFKILQQSFTKLNIMKHIEIQKLVKCKYQDNLEFLQWFKKIFDTYKGSDDNYSNYGVNKQERQRKQSRDKISVMNASSISGDSYNCLQNNNGGNQNELNFPQNFINSQQNSKSNTQRPSAASVGHTRNNSAAKNGNNNNLNLPPHPNTPLVNKYSSQRNPVTNQSSILRQTNLNVNLNAGDSKNPLKSSLFFDFENQLQTAMRSTENDQQSFYLRKISQIQHLMDDWNCQRNSIQLIQNIRKIIMVPPETNWEIINGQYIEKQIVNQTSQKVQRIQHCQGQQAQQSFEYF